MIDGIEIIDAHMHLFTDQFVARKKKYVEEKTDEYKRAFRRWYEWFESKYNSDLLEEKPGSPLELAHD